MDGNHPNYIEAIYCISIHIYFRHSTPIRCIVKSAFFERKTVAYFVEFDILSYTYYPYTTWMSHQLTPIRQKAMVQ